MMQDMRRELLEARMRGLQIRKSEPGFPFDGHRYQSHLVPGNDQVGALDLGRPAGSRHIPQG